MFSTTMLIYAGLLAVVVLLVVRRPAVALGAFMCTYGLEQWAQSRDSWFYVNSSFTNIATVCVLLWALLVRRFQGVPILAGGVPRVFWMILGLYAWAVFSLAWTIAPESAFANFRDAAPYLIAGIAILPLLVRDRWHLQSGFYMTLLLGSVVLLLLTFDSQWVGRHVVLKQGVAIGSIKGKGGNPLATASLAGWVGLIALQMNFRGAARFWQLARWPILALALMVTFRSGSRGQLFAMCTAGIVFLPFSRRVKNIWSFLSIALGVMLLLVLATWAFDQFAETDSNRWDLGNMARTWEGSRLNTSLIVVGEWAEGGPLTWLIGLGTSGSYVLIGFYPHLVMAEVLAELGLIGFTLLWVITIYTFVNYAKLHAIVKLDPIARGLAAAVASIFLFEVILSFKQGAFLGSEWPFGFAVILGQLYEAERRALANTPWGAFPSDPAYQTVDAWGNPVEPLALEGYPPLWAGGRYQAP